MKNRGAILALLLIIFAAGCEQKAIGAKTEIALSTVPSASTTVRDASTGERPENKPRAVAEDEALDNVEHHALPQTKVGFYAVFLPEAYAESTKRYPLVVILHGSGSTEVRHGKLANDFGRGQAIYVVPRAPHAHHGVFTERGTAGWTAWPTYPEKWGKWDSPEFPKERLKDVDARQLYVDWIAAVVQDVRRQYRVTEQKAVVYGHSQGAAFAHDFAVMRPDLVKAYFAFAGYYGQTTDKPELAGPAVALKQNRVRITLAHHEADDVVKVEETRLLSQYFKRHGVEHVTHILPAGSHVGSPELKGITREFIRRECCAEKESVAVEE